MSNMHTKERMAPPLRRKLQPPGPRGHLFGNARDLERDPLGFLLELVHMYGDAVRLRLLMWPMYLINHPDDIQQVLQRNAHNYSKDTFDYRILVPFLGKGLLTNDGTSWLHQRRLIQPAFH